MMVIWAAILGAWQGFGLYWIEETRGDSWAASSLALFDLRIGDRTYQLYPNFPFGSDVRIGD